MTLHPHLFSTLTDLNTFVFKKKMALWKIWQHHKYHRTRILLCRKINQSLWLLWNHMNNLWGCWSSLVRHLYIFEFHNMSWQRKGTACHNWAKMAIAPRSTHGRYSSSYMLILWVDDRFAPKFSSLLITVALKNALRLPSKLTTLS